MSVALALLGLGRLRRSFCWSVWLRLISWLILWSFIIRCIREADPLYDFAPRRWLFVCDNQRTVGSLVNEVVLGLDLGDRSEPKEKGNQRCTSVDAFHK
jgi:hypothetical protein